MSSSSSSSKTDRTYKDDQSRRLHRRRLRRPLREENEGGESSSSSSSECASSGEVEEEGQQFRARCRIAGTLTRTLEAIHDHSKSQIVTCRFSKDGIEFNIEESSKSLQASVTLSSFMFQEIEYVGKEEEFQVRLCTHLLIECLNVFGHSNIDNTSLAISCHSTSEIFSMILEENGVVTECELITVAADETEENNFFDVFRKRNVLNRAIIKSDRLRDAFMELADLPGASAVCLTMSPREPRFRMEARGSLFTLTIDLTPAAIASADKESKTTQAGHDGTFIDFISEATQMYRYRVSSLRHVFRALGVARETLVQINEDGMLMVDHMLREEGQSASKVFVHFVLFPLECAEEDQGEDAENGDGSS